MRIGKIGRPANSRKVYYGRCEAAPTVSYRQQKQIETELDLVTAFVNKIRARIKGKLARATRKFDRQRLVALRAKRQKTNRGPKGVA